MPRSIFAMRSWWRMTIAVIAIAPPTRIATIGISSGPKPKTESTNLTRRLLRFVASLRDSLPIFCSTRHLRAGLLYAAPTGLELILVELTGIEPVASWLQTRRSPS